MDADKLAKAEGFGPPPIQLKITRKEAAYLYNLLCDNARTWNATLRYQLEVFVNATDSYNARINREP